VLDLLCYHRVSAVKAGAQAHAACFECCGGVAIRVVDSEREVPMFAISSPSWLGDGQLDRHRGSKYSKDTLNQHLIFA
jgi:hypothetical protein